METTFIPGVGGPQLSAVRALNVNVPIRELDIRQGNATSAVRLQDVEFLVFVKPTTQMMWYSPGSTVTRNVTVTFFLTDPLFALRVQLTSPIRMEILIFGRQMST